MYRKVIVILFYILFQSTIGLGQVLKFKNVQKLPSSVNSNAEESMPFITADGQRMYFVRSFYKGNRGGQFGGQDIWLSSKKDSIWLRATNQLGVLNNNKNNVIIGLGEDNKTLYLLDSYGGTVHGIAFSRHFNGKWTKPEKIQLKGLTKEGYLGFYMNPSLDILLISMRKSDSFGQEDLYVSLKDSSGHWGEPQNLGATINSSGFEISPFLSADSRYLFFASDGPSGFGDADIFYSERLYDSWNIWSVPKNLGPVINSIKFDAYFTIAQDSVIYFSSNRSSDLADIYTSNIFVEEKSVSQARVDSLIKEAESLISELKTINPRNREEILVLYKYNSFGLSQNNQDAIRTILEKIEDKSKLTIELEAYSGEDYTVESKLLISNKRTRTISEYLKLFGISNLDISIRSHSISSDFEKFKEDKIGAVKITFKI